MASINNRSLLLENAPQNNKFLKMDHLFSHSAFLILLVVTISHAAELTSREYWNSVLPKTPMPNAIAALLHSSGINPNFGKRPQIEAFGCSITFSYGYQCHGPGLHSDANVATFFLEKDLHPGKKMTLHFAKTIPDASNFIPRPEANKLPFSSSKFPEILDHFKLAKDSPQANEIKQTLQVCEQPAISGEKKYCATSLESMMDFATSSLKTHDIHAVSTNVNSPNAPKQDYTIIKSKLTAHNELVACHVEAYAYAVFYCHMTMSTKAYKVNLVGKDGGRVDATAVCHMDTSSWNPKHLAFQMLKVQPGAVPICHFIPQDSVVWIRAM